MLDALLEAFVSFLVEFVFYTILYGIGWITLKIIFVYHPHTPARRGANKGISSVSHCQPLNRKKS